MKQCLTGNETELKLKRYPAHRMEKKLIVAYLAQSYIGYDFNRRV